MAYIARIARRALRRAALASFGGRDTAKRLLDVRTAPLPSRSATLWTGNS